ncbi:hypothetical protein SKAU_G00166840 [Synaphobranchus kaupii]|uniref:Uncharacterized protein n=1 Tax=Synaphobranchus kaupii TaxID=118154 RepID=A0A9Q1FK27_SYNKA|nr:hypothetical protein SKAU_G00166840 [Synaphobranchus kaupii]
MGRSLVKIEMGSSVEPSGPAACHGRAVLMYLQHRRIKSRKAQCMLGRAGPLAEVQKCPSSRAGLEQDPSSQFRDSAEVLGRGSLLAHAYGWSCSYLGT